MNTVCKKKNSFMHYCFYLNLPVIPVAPNTVTVCDPCEERPPNPSGAFARPRIALEAQKAIITTTNNKQTTNKLYGCLDVY